MKFPKLMTNTKSKIQEVHRTSSKADIRKHMYTAEQIIFKLHKTKYKEKILKKAKEEDTSYLQRTKDKNYSGLIIQLRRELNEIFKMLKKKKEFTLVALLRVDCGLEGLNKKLRNHLGVIAVIKESSTKGLNEGSAGRNVELFISQVFLLGRGRNQ